MKRNTFLLLVLAIVMVVSASIGTAWAYFTVSDGAEGSQTVGLAGGSSTVTETFDSWTKHVVVTNDEGSAPVYVRAKAFYGDEYDVTMTGSEGWTAADADGWYNYSGILNGGEATTELLLRIDGAPESAEVGDSFNIVVVYETTPVQHDASGNAYADWNVSLDAGTTEGGD